MNEVNSMKMIILIDNGHGSNTAGKCSPDGKHREYLWARQFAERLEKALKARGMNAQRIVTEERDISIKERCRRVNLVCKEFGKANVLLVSIHNNAAGSDGKWHDARGWSAHVSLNASTKSKQLATRIAEAVEARGFKMRKPLPKQPYWPQNLGICRDTNCPAVLTENFFQDNREDVTMLQDAAVVQTLVEAHADGITNFINAL